MSNVKQKPIIDELLDEYYPKSNYSLTERSQAKKMALAFFKSARQEYAMQDEINTALFLGRELTQKEKNRNLKRWGF